MKYTYAYRTSDGTRHEASLEAKCREDVFAALRKQGIKAIKVVAADGSKANGEVVVRGVRKRIVAIVAIIALLISFSLVYFLNIWGLSPNPFKGQTPNDSPTNWGQTPNSLSAPRHQIYGDPVIVEEFEHGRFDHVFTNRLDQMLAWFAQPGKLMCPRGTDLRRAADSFAHELSVLAKSENGTVHSSRRPTLRSAISLRSIAPLAFTSSDPREVRELKQIVNGLREEMVAYLANGNGTPRSYWRRLIQRTQQEAQIYERTRRELEDEKSDAVWERKNESLRLLGLRPIPRIDDSE